MGLSTKPGKGYTIPKLAEMLVFFKGILGEGSGYHPTSTIPLLILKFVFSPSYLFTAFPDSKPDR